jgi:hypothetical protein
VVVRLLRRQVQLVKESVDLVDHQARPHLHSRQTYAPTRITARTGQVQVVASRQGHREPSDTSKLTKSIYLSGSRVPSPCRLV